MDIAAIVCLASSAFIIAYIGLDAIVPPVSVRRVGGLTFWRCGKLGGTLHRARGE